MEWVHIGIDSSLDDIGVIPFLKRIYPGVSKALFFKWIRKGNVRVNGKRINFKYRLKYGDVVNIPKLLKFTNYKRKITPIGIDIDRYVLYRDDNLLIVDKPQNIPVHKGTGHRYGLVDALRDENIFQPIPINRLDMDTRGIVVFAKNIRIARYLKEQWRCFKRFYMGVIEDKRGIFRQGITYHIVDRISYKNGNIIRDDSGNRVAYMNVRVFCVINDYKVLVICIGSGYKHQIRAQLSWRGVPLLGDRRYSGKGARYMGLIAYKVHIYLDTKEINIRMPLNDIYNYIMRLIPDKKG